MTSGSSDTHSHVMVKLQDWVRSTGPENYALESQPFESGTALTLAIYHDRIVKVINNSAVVLAIRDICANVPEDYGLDHLLAPIKDMIARAVLGHGLAGLYRKSGTTKKQLLEDLDTAARQAKGLSRQIERLEGRIPKAAFGVQHLSHRLAKNEFTDAGMYSVTGWDAASKKTRSDVPMSGLLKMLAFEISNHAERVRGLTASGSRQIRSKKMVQRLEAMALLQTADQRLDFSRRKRLKPHHNLVHAILCCLWGDMALERSYISRLSNEMKTQVKNV